MADPLADIDVNGVFHDDLLMSKRNSKKVRHGPANPFNMRRAGSAQPLVERAVAVSVCGEDVVPGRAEAGASDARTACRMASILASCLCCNGRARIRPAGAAGRQAAEDAAWSGEPDDLEYDPITDNNQENADIFIEVVDLRLNKTVNNNTPSDGMTVIYTLNIRNRGPLQTTGVSVVDNLPLGVTYVNHTASQGDDEVQFTALEFDILRYLIQHRGRTVTRKQLLRDVWGIDENIITRTIDRHVASLRKKIEPDPDEPTYIQTVYGIGYKFVG